MDTFGSDSNSGNFEPLQDTRAVEILRICLKGLKMSGSWFRFMREAFCMLRGIFLKSFWRLLEEGCSYFEMGRGKCLQFRGCNVDVCGS